MVEVILPPTRQSLAEGHLSRACILKMRSCTQMQSLMARRGGGISSISTSCEDRLGHQDHPNRRPFALAWVVFAEMIVRCSVCLIVRYLSLHLPRSRWRTSYLDRGIVQEACCWRRGMVEDKAETGRALKEIQSLLTQHFPAIASAPPPQVCRAKIASHRRGRAAKIQTSAKSGKVIAAFNKHRRLLHDPLDVDEITLHRSSFPE